MHTEIKLPFLNIQGIREQALEDGYDTSQEYRGIRPDTASSIDTQAEILRKIGPGFKMVAIIQETINFDNSLGGGSSYSERTEEWDDKLLSYYFNEFTLTGPLKDPVPLKELIEQKRMRP